MKSHKTFRFSILPALLVPGLLMGLMPARAHAATLVVTTTADPGIGGCKAAGNGDGCTLREAIIDANNQTLTPGADTINATGISGIITLATALPVLNTNIILNGPGATHLTVQRSSATSTLNFRIFNIDTSTVSLSGLTVSGGKLAGASAPATCGGAVYNDHGILTVSNTVFKANSATDGGAVCNDGSGSGSATLTLINNTFTANIAANGGGALFNNGSGGGSTPLIIRQNVFSGNRAVDGGAILNDGHNGGSATITELSDSVLSNNIASGNGGAIENNGIKGSATLVITYTSLSSNSAVNGGAINNDGRSAGSATQNIKYSTFNGNKASANGGAINNDGRSPGSATLAVGTSTFYGNTATGKGGAIENIGTGAGGSATVEIDNSTMKANAASVTSAAIDSNGEAGSATLALGSTILANGPGKNLLLTVNSETTFTSKNHNLSTDAAGGDGTKLPGGPYLKAGGDMRNTDPKLGAFQKNGGPTATIAILTGSPAIDQGLSNLPTDQRGAPRPYDYATIVNASGGNGSDIGAFEISPDTTAPTVTLTTPANNSSVVSLPAISGKASDNTGGFGLDHIALYLRRNSDNKYWTGTAWGTTSATLLTTTLSGTSWTRNGGLPTGANLKIGTYFTFAYAYDKAGNRSTGATSTFTVIDKTLPTVTLTTPANNTTVSSLPAISGAAADNAGGAGVDHVALYLRRNSDNKYWTGTAWGTTSAELLTTTLSGTSWARNGGLPTGANLAAGSYFAFAYAYDKVSNRSIGATSTFTVGAALRWVPTDSSNPSSVTLSSTSASVAYATAALVFTGALDVATATDAGRYSVTVNGVEVIVESAALAGSSVTLGLGEGTLQAGDAISVTYDLLDEKGRTLQGQADLIAH